MKRWQQLVGAILLALLAAAAGMTPRAQAAPPPPQPSQLFSPLVLQKHRAVNTTCGTTGEAIALLPVNPPPSDRPAALHADLNLALRGYTATPAERSLQWIDGPTDVLAPQLFTLFADQRLPHILGTFQVFDWDWDCNCRGAPISDPPVTLIAVQSPPGETLYTPASGYTVGSGYQALVLYADPHQLTLKYTRDDNVVRGYTLHLTGLCVGSDLVATYQAADAAGRAQLPALRAGQALGRSLTGSVLVAIRDTGRFMDPRSQKDWWRFGGRLLGSDMPVAPWKTYLP